MELGTPVNSTILISPHHQSSCECKSSRDKSKQTVNNLVPLPPVF